MREKGIPLDFTMADFELLIVNEKTTALFNTEDVQLFEVKIEKFYSKEKYFLMTTRNENDCVDEEKSIFDTWEINNPIWPDLAGQYKTFYKLAVRKELNTSCEIFRIKKYHSIIIINENLKKTGAE